MSSHLGRRVRRTRVLAGVTLTLVAGSILAAPLAASAAAPTYEIESSISIEPGTLRPSEALYNPVNDSTYFVNTSKNLVIVIGPDGTVTNLTVSSPYALAVDATGNVWAGGRGDATGKNLTRIAPDLSMSGVAVRDVSDVSVTPGGGVSVISDGMPGRISVVSADLSITGWDIDGNVRNTGITTDQESGLIYLSGNRDIAGTTETGTWIYEPSGVLAHPLIPTSDQRARYPVYNAATGRVYVPLSESGVMVINRDFSSVVIDVPNSSNGTATVLADGRVAVLPGNADLPVSFINADNTYTSTPASFATAATQDARGAVFLSTSTPGLIVVHADGTTETLASLLDSGPVLYSTGADRIIHADLNSGALNVIKAVTAAPITPVKLLTPGNDLVLEPGFEMTGEGEPDSFFMITDGSGDVGSRVNIESDGTWRTSTASHLLPGDYVWTLTQDADGSTAELRFTIAADPVVTPVSVTSPGEGATVGVRPTFTGAGTPGAVVTVSEDGTVLGEATVDADGVWLVKSMVDLAAGAHSVVATQDVDSSTAAVSFTVKVVPPGSGGGTKPGDGQLAATGADSLPFILIGGALAAAGAAATVLGIRRRRSTD